MSCLPSFLPVPEMLPPLIPALERKMTASKEVEVRQADKIEPLTEHDISFRRTVNQPGPRSLSSPTSTILPALRVEVC